MNTWTLIAIARSTWGIPRILEVVTGIKTNKMHEVSASLYQKHAECHEVAIKKEEKKHANA
jgi:hypothetical protein